MKDKEKSKGKNRIDLEVLLIELASRVGEFYPYFLGFYILALFISLWSGIWRSFFYWPGMHISIIIFTVLFLLGFKYKFKLRFDFNLFSKLTKHFFNQSVQYSKIFLFFLKNKFVILPLRTKIIIIVKILLIFSILVIAFFKNIRVIEFFVLTYALISVLFVINSRLSAALALVGLISCPILIVLKEAELAEGVATYVYYFLIITILTQISSLRSENKTIKADNIRESNI